MKERIFVFSFFTRSCSFDSVLLYSTRSSHRQALILHRTSLSGLKTLLSYQSEA